MGEHESTEGPSDTWVDVQGTGAHPGNSATARPPEELRPAVEHGPLGPKKDPVFPSLPSADVPIAPVEMYEVETSLYAAIPLVENIFTLTRIPSGGSRDELLDDARRLAAAPPAQRLGEFDQPEKDRIFAIAELFVRGHVRRISKSFAIRRAHPDFGVGTIVISEDVVPRSRLRHARFQWAVTPHGFVQLENAKLPVGHLGPLEVEGRPMFASPHRGDDSDVAFLLAYVCDLIGATLDQSVAGVGAIGLLDNHLLFNSGIDTILDGAKDDRMDNVILPYANKKISGQHEGVRYWSARDSNEAIFSLFTALAHEVLVPNLYRRAMTKEAYSWFSLVSMLVAVCGFQLAVALGRRPPVEFLRYLLGSAVLLVIGSLLFTHRYLRFDR